MKASKEHIDCIIYLIKSASDRFFYDMEKELIKELIQYDDIEIIFCSNTFGLEEESDEYYRNKEIVEDCLSSIMREIPGLKDEKMDKILDRIISVNLIKKMKNNKEVLVNCYGIDKLLGKMYEIMSKKKIDETDIRKATNLSELIEKTKNYPLLKMFKDKGDFKMKNRINLSKHILSCAKGDFWRDFFIVGFFTLNSRRKDMVKHIVEKYGDTVDPETKLKEIEEIISKDWKNYSKDFFESMSPYKTILQANGFDFNPLCYNEYTIAIGSYLLKKYEENAFLFDNNATNTILELSRGINNGIDGLNKLSDEWAQIKKDNEDGKSNIEWVRRFFKLSKRD